ncbi:carbamoyltransferase C-terminal domain-containing protein [Actinokineospora bangkokensis]|uniref:Carbamoyltransferase n=1 Tax=Actinokineospora bangkokensis TaxID=1193682 RepID=A0A1Q9LIP1_9PSEU|nr:carbamoyltransferase C-terminal domain-containing protein [Actinokineospora bangkokensis]OLR91865.1 hypothetical protein BJP25_23810 [Actinokineospora bangkokensis]
MSGGYVLGVNWWFHDGAAAVVDPAGNVLWMAEEERFTRHRHGWGEFPVAAVAAGLAETGVDREEISLVAVGWQPWLANHPSGQAWRPSYADPAVLAQDLLGWDRLPAGCTFSFFDHHDAHAASAFYASPFDDAAVLVVDGHGERASVSIHRGGRRTGITPVECYPRPFSLGYFYEAATRHLGFRLLEAGKTMGLASYALAAEPLFAFADGIPPGARALRADCTWDEAATAWGTWFQDTYGPVSTPTACLHRDPLAVRIAAQAQATVAAELARLVARARELTGLDAVCIGGGVAQNCVAMGAVDEPVYVPPFAHDAGVSLGAAWLTTGGPVLPQGVSPYLGAQTQPRTADQLAGWMSVDYTPDLVADLLRCGQVGAVYTGRAEVGARALGHRSVIARPDDTAVRDRVNRMKGREPWRPLAPAGLAECDGVFWDSRGSRSRYMTASAPMTDLGRSSLPGATHVDGTCRMQVVRETGVVHDVLRALRGGGHDPVVLNTSFNDRGDPIAHAGADVAAAAERMGLDFLVWDDELLRPAGGPR